jgi:hypothetical protein
MKKLILITALAFPMSAFAGPECTKEPKAKWKDAKAFEQELAKEYKINKFKITSGNCYEIYGFNKENKKVEIYFNPITGKKVKEEIH